MADSLRILVLTPFPPRLDGRHGGSRVTAGFVTALARRHSVALLYLARGGDDVDDAVREACETTVRCPLPEPPGRLRTLAPLLAGRPRWVTLARSPEGGPELRRLAADFRPDVIQCEFAVMTQYLPPRETDAVPRVLVQHEPATARAGEDAAAALGQRRRARIAARVEERAWRRFETEALRRVDAAVVFGEADREALRSLGAPTPVHVIPFGLDVAPEPLDPAGATDRATIAFAANFVHKPNVQAARRLVLDVLPRVRRERPDVEVVLVGRAPPPEVASLAGDGVEVTGEVPSVTPYLDRANLVVVPLAIGGGIRVKVIEALGAGKAVVATRLAAAGLPVRDREHLYLAETDDELADAVLELLADGDARAALGRRARAWTLEHAGWDEAIDAYDRLYRSLLGGAS
jgi:polysaccharide biosynthesis protein PslH